MPTPSAFTSSQQAARAAAAEEAALRAISAHVAKHGLKPFPRSVHRLNELVRNPDYDIREVARTIETDSTLR